MAYEFRGFIIPARMLESLKKYRDERVPVGDFLRAVISNNLEEAVSRADDHNLANLPAYVGWLYNEAPSSCWGSPRAYANWIDSKSKED